MRAKTAFEAVASLIVAAMLCSFPTAMAKKDGPTVEATKFKHYPSNINYFRDSDVVMFHDQRDGVVYRSTDAGVKWSPVEGVEKGQAFVLVMHQYDSNRAYILTQGATHWRTHDRGKTWQTFFTDAELSIFRGDWLGFHAGDPDRILFYGMDCQSIFCDEVVMYTIDGFKDDAKFLRGSTTGCWWAKSSELFTTGQDDLDSQRILCIVKDTFTPFKEDQRLLISDNYFSATGSDGVIQEFEPYLDMANPIQGIVSMAIVKKHLLVATASKNTDEMALYVTDDTLRWHRAMFPTDHRLNQEAYTILESTNYSIQVDVMNTRPSNPMGILFTSNSNGTFFTRTIEHTNRNTLGHVDFEKISGIQGIFLVNQVDNWESVEKDVYAEKKQKTMITFDDGRTFEPIKAGKDIIHLHSITELDNTGRVFSSPAPGLVMGNGNRGEYLTDFAKSDLYVSDDAGRTWTEGLKGPHKYEFGDQGSILVAVGEDSDVGQFQYSLNHGKDWTPVDFPDKLRMKPWILTTTQDSTSLKFLLVGQSEADDITSYYIISIDFEGLHEATCTSEDMEDWFARVDDDGKPSCLMGHTQKYTRRKKDAGCFIKQEFKDPIPETKPCQCTDDDFECDFNFVRKDGDCVKAGPILVGDGQCKSGEPEETFQGSSGWRLIPGNDCKRADGKQKDDPKEWKCSDSTGAPSAPASGKISHKQIPFKGDFDKFEKHYLERGDSSSQSDETVILRPYRSTHGGDIFITQDHGKTWEIPSALKDEKIFAILPHQYFKDVVFFIKSDGTVIYTIDRGLHFDSFKAPNPMDTTSTRYPLAFHPDKKDWLIWHGQECRNGNTDCYQKALISTDRGDSWKTMVRYVEKCEFTGSSAYRFRPEKQIICLAREHENDDPGNPLQIVYSDDFFQESKEVGRSDVKDFATMAEFIVVATENQTSSTLNALASLDGEQYAQAHFPYNFHVPHQRAYTVLDSSTHAVNLFVVTETEENRRYGTILKSNSNGTSYVLSVSGVNCDNAYYVDFEKMLGLEGVGLVNIVANSDSTDSEPKRLQSKITHNDGAQWAFIPPPAKDVDGKPFECKSVKGDEACALHIHGYTERVDRGKTYSSESAIGLMFGIGNVGPSLGEASSADTFMTNDAGITWKHVKKGRWMWSIGDQGSIVVLAERNTKTKSVSYSTDEGATWADYQFSDTEVVIDDITTQRSGSSRNFLVWGHAGDQLFTVNLDFTGLSDRVCQFDKDDKDASDYYIWSPKHPMQENDCIFGHVSQYLRKKTEKQCSNGFRMQHLYNLENCTCTRQDYECDYNFEMDNHGACSLVEGLLPKAAEEFCKENPDAIEYYPTGYRKIPLSTCQGGTEFDKASDADPCDGHEEEFERSRRVSGVTIFFAVTIPIAAAAAAGWYVWRNWEGKFGQIRLGEQGAFDSRSPWVKYPVIVISALVAVVGTLPLVAGAVWRSASSAFEKLTGKAGSGSYSWLRGSGPRRFTTRDSFARGRGDYAIVDEDEGELLGEDSDEEV